MNIFKSIFCDAKCIAIDTRSKINSKKLNSLKEKDFDTWCRLTHPQLEKVTGSINQLESFQSNSGADGYYAENVAVATTAGRIYVVRDFGQTFKSETYKGNKIVRFEEGIFEYE